jgi:quercetin dioxygenase-like cupin family protein
MNIDELVKDQRYSSVDHPYVEFAEVDDIWVRAYSIEKAESIAAQHVHTHDHITLVSRGTVEAWQDEERLGVYTAPAIIKILAGKKHLFKALTDDVVFCCLHNLRGTGLESPEIMEGV